jgi:hypothetical protein
MSDQGQEPKDKDLLENLGYEKSDVEPKPVSAGVIAFFAFTVVSFFTAYIFVLFIAPDIREVPDESELERQRLPEDPYPLLQSNVTASKDMSDMRIRELAAKQSYRWVDEDAGIVAVPEDVAIDLALEGGRLSMERAFRPTEIPEEPARAGEEPFVPAPDRFGGEDPVVDEMTLEDLAESDAEILEEEIVPPSVGEADEEQ